MSGGVSSGTPGGTTGGMHGKAKYTICPKCPAKFNDVRGLQGHLKMAHNITAQVSNIQVSR